MLLKYLVRKPLVLTCHGLDLTFPHPFYQWLLKQLLPKADTVVVVSQPVKKVLNRFAIPEVKIKVISNGISLEHFKKKAPLPCPVETRGKIVLLTVGHLVPRKGHGWFIEKVLAKLPKNYIYLIVGEGPEKNKIIKSLKSLKLESRVFLLGRVSDAQLSSAYKQADIYVCPNVHIEGDFEGFGIAAGEAAAMGLPVIASNIDGISAVIKNGENGRLIPPDEDKFLKMLRSLQNKKLRSKMGEEARVFTRKNYSWQKTAKEYLSVFEEVIGKK